MKKGNFKEIHMGNLISTRVSECKIEIDRICNFFKTDVRKIEDMYQAESMDSALLLKWSKLLEYDFFRIYSMHLILYSPSSSLPNTEKKSGKLPQFRKNIYTQEIIEFIIELIKKGEKTRSEVIQEYRIPKSTLHKWFSKYNNEESQVKISENKDIA
ncbi:MULTISPECIES: transposase [Chryseobacterium]|uniref:transposase n=1 Tax=Chryseobacterium TaxID=59732 RepID=UPI000D12728F|nr:transposase [Chryseobacterium aurantiacum]